MIMRQDFSNFIPLLKFLYCGEVFTLGDSILSFFAVLRMSSDVVEIGMFIYLVVLVV